MHGMDVEPEDSGEVAPLECPRCQRETPRDKSHCVWCNQALSQQAVEALDTTVDTGLEDLQGVDAAEATEMFTAFVQFAREHPELVPEDVVDHDDTTSTSSSSWMD
jgi:hypothetical protein